jgi:hypothetical protein
VILKVYVPMWVRTASVAAGLAIIVAGCGDGGDQAKQTEEMDQHLQEVTQNYASEYAQQYRGKGQ